MRNIILLLSLLFSVVIFAQKMQLSSSNIEFGEIQKGKESQKSITVTNTGNAPLIIMDVKPSCGCTVPSWPKKPIMPGKSETLVFAFDAAEKGAFNKVVEVFSNDGSAARKIIRLKGVVN